jgi:hypothetical protein
VVVSVGKIFKKDFEWSNEMFLKQVWPNIKYICGGGNLIPLEMSTEDFAKQMDQMCGIDYMLVNDGLGMVGLASRVQKIENNKPWNTFTIRFDRDSGAQTEYEKRKIAIESNKYIYPYLTTHAYVNQNGYVNCGVAKTVDIYNAINLNNIRRNDNVDFLYVNFNQVKDVKVIYKKPEPKIIKRPQDQTTDEWLEEHAIGMEKYHGIKV